MEKADRRLFHEISREKNKDKKLVMLSELFDRNKDDYSVMFSILKLLGTYPMYRERAKELMELLGDFMDPSSISFEIGKMESFDKNYDKAIDRFKESLFYSPSAARAKLELGKAYKKTGDITSAKKAFLELTARADKAAFYELGVIAEDNNEFDEARRYYKRVLSIKKNDARTLFKLGLLEEKCGNVEFAKCCFSRANEIAPNDFITLTKLSTCERELGKFDSALRHAKNAVSINSNPIGLLELGIIYEELGEFDKAYASYIKALKDEDIAIVNYRVAILLKKSGCLPEAKKYLLKCLGTELNSKALVELTDISLKENDIEQAEDYVDMISDEEIENDVDLRNFKRINMYIKHKKSELLSADNHYASQILDYDEYRAIEVSKNYFGDRTDIKDVFSKVKSSINNDNYHNSVSAEDFYIVDLDNPAYDKDDKPVKKVVALTVLNSDKIISFMPTYKKKVRLSKKR